MLGLGQVATGVQPAQLLQAVVIGLARQVHGLSRLASSTPSTWRWPSQLTPIAISAAWL